MSDPSGQYRPLFATLELTTTRMTQALAQIALLHADLAMLGALLNLSLGLGWATVGKIRPDWQVIAAQVAVMALANGLLELGTGSLLLAIGLLYRLEPYAAMLQ